MTSQDGPSSLLQGCNGLVDDPTTPLQGCIQSIAELTALYTQLHGIELYVRQYYLNEGSTGSGDNGGGKNTHCV